ncbi:hypothetical protein C3941_09305 [Kaistia algarum]|uniref:hypothetical protein n=1 Tax=Kaistia algarum TaxID=2083279 RepID=UPI000CE7C106|nr:hypothetical protein [Kaistia algarum]MCX5512256.1 hypothetical protein [Kaistia algarum]PPE80347.1 hypothetical protein C3941_09305 [Kaistia algarum]
MTDDVLKMFEYADLRPARTTDVPAVHDLVEFTLFDGVASATGRVATVLPGDFIVVSISGIGNFIVPPGRATVIARAN